MKFSIIALATLALGVIAAPAPEADASNELVARTWNKCSLYKKKWEKCQKDAYEEEHEYRQCKKGTARCPLPLPSEC
jgi:hypothetical protein